MTMPASNEKTPLPDAAADAPLLPIDSAIFRNVKVTLEARLGASEVTIEELTALKPGATLSLDRSLADPIEIYLNGALVARGEIVAVDDRFAVRIEDVAPVE
ncbi:MAG TPA: FliM/FliN family flagellar motor switch protein [Allosphingosinicella sp.]|nr:FliM/FliN family flagellar motor switch protein [Allosphingosinicella sp.]